MGVLEHKIGDVWRNDEDVFFIVFLQVERQMQPPGWGNVWVAYGRSSLAPATLLQVNCDSLKEQYPELMFRRKE